jgi:hypothetical protein
MSPPRGDQDFTAETPKLLGFAGLDLRDARVVPWQPHFVGYRCSVFTLAYSLPL